MECLYYPEDSVNHNFDSVDREKVEKLNIYMDGIDEIVDISDFVNVKSLKVFDYKQKKLVGLDSLKSLREFRVSIESGHVNTSSGTTIKNFLESRTDLEVITFLNEFKLPLDLSQHTSLKALTISINHGKGIKIPSHDFRFRTTEEPNFIPCESKLHKTFSEHIIPHGIDVGDRKYKLTGLCRGGYWSEKFIKKEKGPKWTQEISRTYHRLTFTEDQIIDFLSGKDIF